MDISPDAFKRFLAWLHPEAEQAAHEYEALRRRVIGWLERRGCCAAEELADEAIDRVVRRVAVAENPGEIKPIPYFHAVVSHLYLEYAETYAKKRGEQLPEDWAEGRAEDWPDAVQSLTEEYREDRFHCLDHCLQTLPTANRELILAYYQNNKQAKIDGRKQLADQFGLSLNLLRVQVYRIRGSLQKCVTDCLPLG
ncbi:MAG: hypothetical protein HOP19_06275 [Acidobacteria bacterium]|nr:hypothetical protein [Acidobacteriota bacterium]